MTDEKALAQMKIFGENLSKIRQQKNISRKEIAAKVGVKEISYGKYERGETSPTLDKIVEMAKFLDCSVGDLIGDNPAVKGREVWQYRFERSIEILNHIGFSVEEDGEYLTIKEKPKINFSANEITTAPQMTRKFHKHLLNLLVEEVENFAIEKSISFKEAFQYLVFSEKSPYNPKNNLTDYTDDKLNKFANDYR